MSALLGHLALAAGWLSFGAVHSLLAGDAVRNRLPGGIQPFYRLGYNCLAALHLALILWLEKAAPFGRIDFAWPAPVQWVLWGVVAIGGLITLVALSRYDLGAFSGLTEAQAAIRQIREKRAGESAPLSTSQPDIEPLRTDGILALVRHPLYTGLFLMVWGRVTDDQTLATAIWASAYLVVGARFEERRLIRLYGDAYRDYRDRVPAFFPHLGQRNRN